MLQRCAPSNDAGLKMMPTGNSREREILGGMATAGAVRRFISESEGCGLGLA